MRCQSLQHLAAAALSASMLVLTACGNADGEPASATTSAPVEEPTTTAKTSALAIEEVATAAGCDQFEPTGVAFQFAGGAEQFLCRDNGREVALIHSFTADRRERVAEYLAMRLDVSELVPCPDGSHPEGPWIVVGSTWAASSYNEGRMRDVASQLDGEFVGGGATPNDPPIGPPGSYMVPGFCDT